MTALRKKENYFHPENASKFYKEKASNTSKHVKWLKFADKHTPILLVLFNNLFFKILLKKIYIILGMTQNMKVSSNNVNHKHFTIFYQIKM